MTTSIYRASPRKVREWTIDAITSGCVPMVKGPPGIGKSAIMQSIADEFRLKMVDHRLSTSSPEDLSGLPDFERGDVGQETKATFRPFDIFPTRGTPLPDGKDGWLLFLDEANSGLKEVQAASYKLVLDRMTGQLHLHDNVAIALAGNLATDRAIVNPLSTAMQSRLVHILMEVSFREWWEDVALPQDYDPRIKGYLAWKGEASLMNFDPNHDDETFPCPRTWEFMNRMIKGKTFKEITEDDPQQPGKKRTRHEMDGKIGLYAGTIGQGEAVSFVQYCKVTQDIITIVDIIKDPTGCKVPQSAEMKWGQITHLIDQVDDQNFADVCTYINRYDLSFKVLFYRTMTKKNPQLKMHPAFIKAAIELARYLYD
jgi:hypothetical protein